MVEEDGKVVGQNTEAIPVYIFTYHDFLYNQFYAVKWYLHFSKEVSDYASFVYAVVWDTGGYAGTLVNQERANEIEANDGPNLLLDHMSEFLL